jgi:tetratricopeptide (TPR) repeat protein
MLGLNQGVRDVPAYMRAGAIALDVLQRNPDHPGAAHYAIHAFDDPSHAPLGLNAARAYSRIAPGAAHAQHMTTHIFLALGMWSEVIAQNVVAAGPDRGRWSAGHYTYWLHYGLLQAGRIDEAVALLDELRAHHGNTGALHQRIHLALGRAHQAITGERWDDPALGWPLDAATFPPLIAAVDAFTRGYAALQDGNVPMAAATADEMERSAAQAATRSIPRLLAGELQAALKRAKGDTSGAEQRLRDVAAAAAALPVEFGPPDFVKPPYELLGEWLLADGRHAEAKQAFESALALMPGRLLSLRGLDKANAALAIAVRVNRD